ncbi:MAG TPA: hypothetical protein DCE55_23685 [Planctomycetaceae bacterium]|nr:hypothetical protein [Planctomycetaceae bacterium]|tara:strand:- start:147 stop:332 length:186 start_codon:yes stop_codon:yes gene_type:complete
MEQKTVEFDYEPIGEMKKKIDKENSEGWYVHQVVRLGKYNSGSVKDQIKYRSLVVYRKDEE